MSRPSGKENRMTRVALMGIAVCALLLLVSPSFAQGTAGLWEAPFDHVIPPNWQQGQPGWDHDPAPGNFLAGHMALIPRGDYRGQVLVWNWMRVDAGAPIDVQYWAIVDPVT